MNCRNGHDLALVGRWMQTPARPLHMQCTTCRRVAKKREKAMNRALRAARVKVRADVCRNGHPRSMSRRRPSGEFRCFECDRLTAKRRRDKLKGVK